MAKTYYDHMASFTDSQLYNGLLGHGMFNSNLPPFLQSVSFLQWSNNQNSSLFIKRESQAIHYESIRNINIPRNMSIPNPIAYRNLCKCLKDNWEDLVNHFQKHTDNPEWKVSRIHIRKISKYEKIFNFTGYDINKRDFYKVNKKNLFEMGFSDHEEDGNPIVDLKIGAKYEVHADISNFFGSIYTHSITWAIAGKSQAKNIRNGAWFNDLDTFIMNTNNGETHGILIGSHAFNLISEIILVVVDKNLIDKNYKFVRHIDDYICFTESSDKADKFLIDLSIELRKFGLILNSKKIDIRELPQATTDNWVLEIHKFPNINSKYFNYKDVENYLNFLINLLKSNNNNAAILKYGLKIIEKKRLSKNATEYLIKSVHHLVLIYPYLVSLLELNIFDKYKMEKNSIKIISQAIINQGIERYSYELISFAIYFSLKYDFNFNIKSSMLDEIGKFDDCLTLLLAYLYDKKKYGARSKVVRQHKLVAERLYSKNEDDYWLYYYEVLTAAVLKDYWKRMKKDKLTFLKPNFNF